MDHKKASVIHYLNDSISKIMNEIFFTKTHGFITKIILPCLFIMLFGCQQRAAHFIEVTKIETNGKAEPMGVQQRGLTFSWQMDSDLRSQYQTAWRIGVASTREALQDGEFDLWDSGKQKGDKNTTVAYEGQNLSQGERYFWKVKVWDKEDRESEWSDSGSFVTGLFNQENWSGAQWIGYDSLPDSLRLVPGVHGSGNELGPIAQDHPVIPQFRKEFSIDKPIEEATLFISGLGHYEASINGQKIGTDFLSPGWTDYEETVLYNTYDVTDKLQSGSNVFGAVVGNGFYNVSRHRYRKLVIAYGKPKLISKLKVTYADGSENVITSGPDWKTSPSPTTFSSIYGGEDYDARAVESGWNRPGFDDSSWENVVQASAPLGEMRSQFSHPNEVMDTLEVKRILESEPGIYIYDFGQNASGIFKLNVRGNRAQQVKLTPAELLNNQGLANQNASGAPHVYNYTLSRDSIESWQPKFTYYGFRYIQVEGAVPDTVTDSSKPMVEDLKFLHTRSQAPATGHFETSHELFTEINSLIKWAVKSNMQSVITDCPHREKLGWLEQTYLMGGGIHYNYDLRSLYKKLVYDMMDAQTQDGLVPDIAPEYVEFVGGFRDSPEWGSASVILPWLLYKWYGDVETMEKAWPMMTKYMDYLQSKADDHILSHGLGDWYDLGPDFPGEAQLTPIALTATATYYRDIKLISKMAPVIGNEEDVERYENWAEDIRQAFNKRFFDQESMVYSTGSQTAMSMPLVTGLVEEQYRDQVFSNLTDSIRANNKALTAGDIGFHYLVKALQEGGGSQLVYKMNSRTDVPGYGYQLEKGATALTESWAALEVVSNNYLMLGHIMEWFYSGLGGIKQADSSIAYKHIVIEPHMIGDIEHTHTEYESSNGTIVSEWEVTGEERNLNVKIPVNSTATVIIPTDQVASISESGKSIRDHEDIEQIEGNEAGVEIRVGSGDYTFVFSQ